MRTWYELGKYWNKCEICGKFIAIADFGSSAVHKLVYPDSEITEETWETFHVDCNWQKPGIGIAAVSPVPKRDIRNGEGTDYPYQ